MLRNDEESVLGAQIPEKERESIYSNHTMPIGMSVLCNTFYGIVPILIL